MASEADRLKRGIDATRQELVRDVGRLTEQAQHPAQLARRELGRVRAGLRSVKERVMGASEQAASTVAEAASDLPATVRAAPRKIADATSGSPVAVGIIAFGAGLLAAALIPESDAEREAVKRLSDNIGPMTEPLQQAGRALADDVRTSVEAAADELKSSAADAAANVGTAAAAGAAEVRTAATEAAAHTLHEGAMHGQSVIEQSRRSLES